MALIGTAFIFSAGMPILLLFGSLCLVSRYYTDKYTTLNLFSKPSYVDSKINTITF